MNPGSTLAPPASIRCVPGPASAAISSAPPTARMRPDATATASARGRAGSIVSTVPLVMIRSALSAIAALSRLIRLF